MKSGIIKIAAVIAALVVVLLLFSSLYSVAPNEYAAVRQFGKIVKIEDTPGLKFKLPFIQNIQKKA